MTKIQTQDPEDFEIPRARVSRSLRAQVELLDIYHYLEKRKENIQFFKLSPRSFGPSIGVNLRRTTFERMLSREDELRAAAETLPDDAHYIVKRKGLVIEQVLLYWLHDQRKKNVPVTGKTMKEAAHFACMVHCDLKDDSGSTVSEAPLSFSAYWFDSLRKQHRISYCQLHGEVGSVDLEAIEPELV
ncbi:hypothetical protein KI688_004397 [Linnemannia hyalina]|uniref:HTH CENPB-type domain-containing protein n=1 Tax=Linnemannia hyalina TaxID=64524 RepID=A0A9P7XN17_9FUNG|nr:hypothetical protein KI688_004397 [Linnemannia hyalina]